MTFSVETYLSDGAYAGYDDGGDVCVFTHNGIERISAVYLNDWGVTELLRFLHKCKHPAMLDFIEKVTE